MCLNKGKSFLKCNDTFEPYFMTDVLAWFYVAEWPALCELGGGGGAGAVYPSVYVLARSSCQVDWLFCTLACIF